jgi:ABC-2 type transport system permease protein
MSGVVVCELRKTSSTSAWWALLIPVVLYSFTEGLFNPFDVPVPAQFSSLGVTSLFALVFGIVCASTEYRHRTLATSYLVVADRAKLAAAKMIVAATVGAGYALISTAMTVSGLLISGFPLGGELTAMLTAGAGAMLVVAFGGILGVGLGMLIGNQLLAVLATLVYLIVVEPIVVLLVDRAGLTTYLPGQSADAALRGLIGVAQPWWLMLLVFAGWVAVVGLAGTLAAQRRDIV